jgi:hypothetical protein
MVHRVAPGQMAASASALQAGLIDSAAEPNRAGSETGTGPAEASRGRQRGGVGRIPRRRLPLDPTARSRGSADAWLQGLDLKAATSWLRRGEGTGVEYECCRTMVKIGQLVL